jgi:hypothetical protein
VVDAVDEDMLNNWWNETVQNNYVSYLAIEVVVEVDVELGVVERKGKSRSKVATREVAQAPARVEFSSAFRISQRQR